MADARRLLAALALALLLIQGARGQDEDPARRVTRWLDYLARRPYHELAFDSLVEAALEAGGLPALSKALAAREDDAGRVLRARLLARRGEPERALEELARVAARPPEHALLSGRLALAGGQPERAAAEFARAAAESDDPGLRERALRARAEALHALGDGMGAAAALGALAELAPDDPLVALEVARRLADWRLFEAAIAQLRAAEARAGDDAARRCEALFERGRVHARLGQPEAALAAWERALAEVGRGAWLDAPLRTRILAAHRRAGTLAALEARRAAAVAAAPHDLRARELWAEALAAQGRAAEALAALAALVPEHPGDRALVTQRRALCAALGDLEGELSEQQRLVAAHPDEVEARLELGALFLRAGRPEAAEREWRRALERRAGDAALARELAERWLEHGDRARAAAAFERAVALDPADASTWAALAALRAADGPRAALDDVLARAEAAAADAPAALDAVAALRARHGDLPGAVRLLIRALLLEPDRPARLRALADALSRHGERGAAVQTLHRLIAVEPDAEARARAAARLVDELRTPRERAARVALERELLAAGRDGRAPYWVLAELHERAGRVEEAAGVYEELCAAAPEEAGARAALAACYERLGLFERALAEVEALLAQAPERARELRGLEVALLSRLGRREAARAALAAQVAAAPDSAATLREASEAAARLGFADQARAWLERATRVDPRHAGARLALAAALVAEGRADAARAELVAAHRHGDAEQRAEAVRRLAERPTALAAEVAELAARVARDPLAVEEAGLLVDLALAARQGERAGAALAAALAKSPYEAELIAARARLDAALDRHDGALAAWASLYEDPERDPEQVVYEFAAACLAAGQPARARALADAARDALRAAQVLADGGRPRDALARLEAVPRGDAQRAAALERAAGLALELELFERALAALEERAALAGDTVATLRRRAELCARLGRGDDALAAARRLFELAGEGPAAEELFRSLGLEADYLRLRAARVVRHPEDGPAVRALCEELSGGSPAQARAALELLDALRTRLAESGRRPAEASVAGWGRTLDAYERACYAARPELARERAAALLAAHARGAPLAEREWNHLLTHARLGSGVRARERDLFREALAAHPESIALRWTVAERHRAALEPAAAAEQYLAALALAERPAPRAAEAEGRARALEAWTDAVRRELAAAGRGGDDALARRAAAMTSPIDAPADPRAGWLVPPRAVLRSRAAVALARAGRRDEALAAAARLEPQDPDRLSEHALWLATLHEAGLADEAGRALAALLARRRALACDAELAGWSGWNAWLREALGAHAYALERAGDAVGAAELLRRAGFSGPAWLRVVSRDLFAAWSASLRARLAAADLAPAERAELSVLLAELLELSAAPGEARAVLSAAAAAAPADPLPARARALLEERAGDPDAAQAAREAALARERARRAALLAGGCDEAGVRVRPFPLLADVDAARRAQRERTGREPWTALCDALAPDPDRDLVEDALEVARLRLLARSPAGPREAIAALVAEGVPAQRWWTALAALPRLPGAAASRPGTVAALRVACTAHDVDLDLLRELVERAPRAGLGDEVEGWIDAWAASHPDLEPLAAAQLELLRDAARAARTAGQ